MATTHRRRPPQGPTPDPRHPKPSHAPAPVAARHAHEPAVRTRVLALAALGLAIVAAFAGVVRNGWLDMDDPGYVTRNIHVTPGLTLRGFLWFLHAEHGGNWHPLTSYSHMLDVQLFGLSPAGPHAVNLALHLASALLLVLVLFGYTRDWWRSLIVGALFGLHPLRVESVAWVSERKDVLSMLFLVLTLGAYRRWAARPTPGRFALVALALALGLASKPMLVTLPFVLVLLDAWPLGRWTGLPVRPAAPVAAPRRPLAGLLLEKWPLLAFAAASAAATYFIQRSSGAMYGQPVSECVANAFVSAWHYVASTAWPARLSPFYPFRPVPVASAVVAALGLVAATALALRIGRARPAVPVGWLWYLGTLVPVIGIVQVGLQARADRYTYVPGIGLLLALVFGLSVPARRPARLALAALAVAAAVALSLVTARQVRAWRSTRSVFERALAAQGESAYAEHGLGNALMEESKLKEGAEHLRRSVELDPRYMPVRRAYGVALARLGRLDEADEQFRVAIRADSNDAGAWSSLAMSAQQRGRLDEAAADYRRALRSASADPYVLARLGIVTSLLGDPAAGLEYLRRAVALLPSDASLHVLLGQAFERTGRDAEAAAELREAVRLAPADVGAANELAWLLATSPDPRVRNGPEAEAVARGLARPGRPGEAPLLDTEAAAHAAAGHMAQAVATARRALAVARRAGPDSLARQVELRLAGYERGRAWVDSTRH